MLALLFFAAVTSPGYQTLTTLRFAVSPAPFAKSQYALPTYFSKNNSTQVLCLSILERRSGGPYRIPANPVGLDILLLGRRETLLVARARLVVRPDNIPSSIASGSSPY